jgi:hypothetical protein
VLFRIILLSERQSKIEYPPGLVEDRPDYLKRKNL